jgi:hypothetical protein
MAFKQERELLPEKLKIMGKFVRSNLNVSSIEIRDFAQSLGPVFGLYFL